MRQTKVLRLDYSANIVEICFVQSSGPFGWGTQLRSAMIIEKKVVGTYSSYASQRT